jgi:hypothetical protein
MASKDENRVPTKQAKVTYHCYDCGGVWDKDGVDIYQTKDLTKYVCKECRGRCLPKDELGRVKGIKSVRQRFGNGRIVLVLLLIIFTVVVLNVYNRRTIINDYKDYLRDTVALRTIINAKLDNYGEDYRLLQKAKKEKVDPELIKKAQARIAGTRKYISARDADIENIRKPDTPEVMDLYINETTFWRDPSYPNFLKYQTTFNKLLKRYGYNYFDLLKEKVRQKALKKR